MNSEQSLFDLQPGDVAVISSYSAFTPDSAKLRALGLVEGERLRVVRYAPMGEPIEIKVRGFYLSLDKQTGENIHVKSLRTTEIEKSAV